MGVTIVGAAGNFYRLGGEVPNSAAPGVFSTLDVGAVWQDGVNSNVQWPTGEVDYTTGPDRVVSFSQRPDTSNAIFAPGAILTSTLPGGRFGQDAGTSIAAPIVTGATAILQEAAYHYGGRYLSPVEVRQVLQATADHIYDGDDENTNVRPTNASYLRVNLYAAVKEVAQLFASSSPPGAPGTIGDSNGTVGGASIGPSLDGQGSFLTDGSIGSDGDGVPIGPTDVDLVRFEVDTPGTFTAETFARDPQFMDTYLRLFDSSGQEITANNDKSASDRYSKLSILLQRGTYYVGVSGYANTSYDPNVPGSGVPGSTGDFRLTLTLTTPDPNGVVASATPLNLIQQPSLTAVSIGSDGPTHVGHADVDLYTVVAPDTGRLTIRLGANYGSSSLIGALRVWEVAPDGRLITLIDALHANAIPDGPPLAPVLTVTPGETVLVGISDTTNDRYDPFDAGSRSATGPGGLYDLSLRFTNGDSNGTLATAVDLPGPVLSRPDQLGHNPDGSYVGPRDVNFYHLRWASGGLLQVRADSVGVPGIADPVKTLLTVWDAAGHRLASTTDLPGDNPVLRYLIQANTDYYVSVSSCDNNCFDPTVVASGNAGSMGSYQLSAILLPAGQAAAFNDGSVVSGSPTAVGPGADLTASIGSDNGLWVGPGDVDLYKFTAGANGPVTVRVAPAGVNGVDPVLRVFDANGGQLGADVGTGPAGVRLIQFTAVAGQVYYFGVTGYSGSPLAYDPMTGAGSAPGSVGTYRLTVAASSERAGFVAGLFQDVLGRPADAATLAADAQGLADAQAPVMAGIAANFVQSPEARAALVQADYATLLGRPAGADEVTFWLGQLQQGRTPDAVVRLILSSPEYLQRAGGTSAGWVNQAYQDLLGRPADPAALLLLAPALDAGQATFDQLAGQLQGSPEYTARVVRSAYQSYLGRSAGDAEVGFWQGYLAQPVAPGVPARSDQFLAAVLTSPEFVSGVGDAAAAWVGGLYQRFLGRVADPAGLQLQVNTLLTGTSGARLGQAQGLLQSDEALDRFVQGLYQRLLGRSGGPSELSAWAGLMHTGLTEAQVFADFLTSAEYAPGSDNATWLDRTYRDVLGRPSDAASQVFLDALNGGALTRMQVATALLAGTEYLLDQVQAAYLTELHRPASSPELNAWIGLIQGGTVTLDQALANVLASVEYYQVPHFPG
jgi:hypothetical protein